jgi:hypothetical protein
MRWVRPAAAIFFLLAALTLAAPVRAQAPDPPPFPTPPADHPDRTFGAVETYHTPDLADAANVGWTRIIFYWSELKKDGPGTWNEFHAPYARIDREIESGREVVGLLKHTPAFATDGVTGAGVPRGLYLPVDDPGNLWAGFVREVVAAYRGRVDRWIIWNEPDIPLDVYGAQWAGTPADYYQLVKVAYLAAHEVNPDAKIHLGGLTYWHDPGYLNTFLEAASADPTAPEHGYYFDVVSLHVYFQPMTTPDIVAALRATLADYGLDKPIWINETNAPPFDDPAQPWDGPLFDVTQDQQAAFLMQEFALALASGVERIAVYKWIDEPPPDPGFEPYGLLRVDRSPRPAFAAYEVITTTYAGAESAQRVAEPGLQQVTLTRDGEVTRVLWADTARAVEVRVPALAESAQLVDQTGAIRSMSPQAGHYTLILPGADCDPDGFCLMGGPPAVVVETAAVDASNWPDGTAEVIRLDPPGAAALDLPVGPPGGGQPEEKLVRGGVLNAPPGLTVGAGGIALIGLVVSSLLTHRRAA